MKLYICICVFIAGMNNCIGNNDYLTSNNISLEVIPKIINNGVSFHLKITNKTDEKVAFINKSFGNSIFFKLQLQKDGKSILNLNCSKYRIDFCNLYKKKKHSIIIESGESKIFKLKHIGCEFSSVKKQLLKKKLSRGIYNVRVSYKPVGLDDYTIRQCTGETKERIKYFYKNALFTEKEFEVI